MITLIQKPFSWKVITPLLCSAGMALSVFSALPGQGLPSNSQKASVPAKTQKPAASATSQRVPMPVRSQKPAKKSISLKFPKTKDGRPERTAGAAIRGSCLNPTADSKTLDPKEQIRGLLPQMHEQTLVGPQAVFFFHVPQEAVSAELEVRDHKESGQANQVYMKRTQLSSEAGIVQIKVPEIAELDLNKTYYWEFSVNCNSQDPTTPKIQMISGTLRRMALTPDLISALKSAQPLEQAALYAEAGVWQETLMIAAELRSQNPVPWQELLTSVELGSFAREPVFNTLENQAGE